MHLYITIKDNNLKISNCKKGNQALIDFIFGNDIQDHQAVKSYSGAHGALAWTQKSTQLSLKYDVHIHP